MKLTRETLFEKIPSTIKGPLNNIVVIEIVGGNVSGPKAANELSRDGAIVIKLEFDKGDPARQYLSPEIFSSLNAGKLSVRVDKNSERYHELLQLADVIIDNRSPSAKKNDGVLQFFLQHPNKIRPVIFCSIVGYNSREHAQKRALDVNVQFATGMASTNGPTREFPLKVGFVVLDITTGIQAASAIKSSLFAIQRGFVIPSDHKQVVSLEVSMAKVSAMLQTGQYLNCITQGKDTFREGNRDLFVAPFSLYKTKDDFFSLGITDDKQFKRFCDHVINRPDLAEKFPTATDRRVNVADLERELVNIFSQENTAYWIQLCEKHNISVGKNNTISQSIREFGKHFFFTQTADEKIIVQTPVNSSWHDEQTQNSAPSLGQHNNIFWDLQNQMPSVRAKL